MRNASCDCEHGIAAMNLYLVVMSVETDADVTSFTSGTLMKSLSLLSTFALGIAVSLLAACSSMTAPPGTMAPVVNRNDTGATAGRPGSGLSAGTPIGSNGIGVSDASRIATRPPTTTVDAGALATGPIETPIGKSIYFDYDQFAVRPEYVDMLKQNFATQKTRDAAPIKLEGNADERGSVEYNLALGQKRAEAVKKQLELLGVPEAQLEAVSFGSEKPRETCHDEKCWAANRRVDLLRQGR
jgi:peptidoglycan-associated lipoprotein